MYLLRMPTPSGIRKVSVRLTPVERDELQRTRSRALPAEQARHAGLILMLPERKSYSAIRQALGCNPNYNYISRWKNRLRLSGWAGPYTRHPGRAVEKRTPALEARILEVPRAGRRLMVS
jgi:hypothetical protein